MSGMLLYEGSQAEKVQLGEYTLSVAFGRARRPDGSTLAPPPDVQRAGELFILTAPDELYVVANNEVEVAVTLAANTSEPPLVGGGIMDEGSFLEGFLERPLAFARRLSSNRRGQPAPHLARQVYRRE